MTKDKTRIKRELSMANMANYDRVHLNRMSTRASDTLSRDCVGNCDVLRRFLDLDLHSGLSVQVFREFSVSHI